MICLFSVMSSLHNVSLPFSVSNERIQLLGKIYELRMLGANTNPCTFGLRVRRRMILVAGDLWRGPGLDLTPKQLQGG
jgi:hypothetical protein